MTLYKMLSTLILRLMAVYIALPVLTQIQTMSIYFQQGNIEGYGYTYLFIIIAHIAIAVCIWIFAPLLTKYTTSGLKEPEETNNISIERVCNTVLIAVGFLILAQSISYHARWLLNLSSNRIDIYTISQALILTALSFSLIFAPKKIFSAIDNLKNGSNAVIKELKK